jgi:hypothetical protein
MLPLNTPSPSAPEATAVVFWPLNLILAIVEPSASSARAVDVSGKAETRKSLPMQLVEISAKSILVNLLPEQSSSVRLVSALILKFVSYVV